MPRTDRARRTARDATLVALSQRVAELVRLRAPGVGVAVVYHRLAERTGSLAAELLPPIHVREFARQVEVLARQYRLVRATELPAAADERRRGEPLPLAITFDDDDLSHLEHAAPVLRAAGAPATAFLCGASLDAPGRFWWDDLQHVVDAGLPLPAELPAGLHAAAERITGMGAAAREAVSAQLATLAGGPPEALDAAAVAALAADLEIGFHTRRHHPLDTLDDEELSRALVEGRAALEQAADAPCRAIAYPNGRADGRTSDAVRGAGFDVGFTTAGRPLRAGADVLQVGRFEPRSRSLGHFALRLAVAGLR